MVSAFIAIVESLEEAVDLINEEEKLIESTFEKMDDQDDIHIAYTKLYKVSEKHEKLYRLAKRKLSEVDFEHKEHSTKVDEANQTHPLPNSYKWLATQQSNSVSSFGNQNQFQLFLGPLGEFFKAVMLLSNFNRFNSPSYPPEQRFMRKKDSSSMSPIWKEKDYK